MHDLTATAVTGVVRDVRFRIDLRAGGRRSHVSQSGSGSSSGSFSSSNSGGGFRSTGSGGSSSSGSFGGFVFLIFVVFIGWLVWTRIKKKSPAKAAAIIAGAGGLAAAGMAAAKAASERSTSAPGSSIDAGGLDEIRAHDPGFDEITFKAGVERSFFLVQKAWCDQDPDLSRQVMADGIWQTHKTQIEEMKSRGRKSVMESLAIDFCRIVAADSNPSKDTIVVLIQAHAKDYEIDVASGKKVDGDNEILAWQERWTYQRSSSATTKPAGGTMEQKCPNCGAPLKVDLAGVCKYCKASIMAGEHDWVLANIDEAE